MDTNKNQEIEHVDERNHNFFMVDNEIIDDYKLSVDADSLYMLIVRRAQHKKTCYPSIRRWMKEKKRGHDKAKKAVKELIEKKLIKIDGRKYTNGPFIYRILPVKKGVSRTGTPQGLEAKGVLENKNGVPASKAWGVLAVGTKEDKVKKTRNKTKNAGSKDPAPFQILGEKWCEFIRIDIKQLTNKDWKSIYQHDKKGADIDQLKALSGVAWKEKKHDLTYLYGQRASLLPKIKPANQKTFFTVEEMQEKNTHALENKK